MWKIFYVLVAVLIAVATAGKPTSTTARVAFANSYYTLNRLKNLPKRSLE